MELPTNIIIAIVIAVLVLVVLSAFFMNTTSPQITTTEAQRIFNDKCIEYGTKNCDWSVTKDASFNDFMKACRQLNGEEREAYSCLYVYCEQCKESTTDTMACTSLCDEARSTYNLGGNTGPVCLQISTECPATECDVC
jgi:hypothetical protein